MSTVARIIQGLILFSTAFGVFFLIEVQPVLPLEVFVSLSVGWVLFLIDSFLTFLRPRLSYYFGILLAVIALGATLSQPAHFQLVASGNLLATATIVLGSGAEVLLIVFGVYFVLIERRSDPWAWPGRSEAPASSPVPEDDD